MGFDKKQFRTIVRHVLQEMDLYSADAEELLLGTCAQESLFGKFLMQLGGGPARGAFGMEPATESDIWNNYLHYRPEACEKIRKVSGVLFPDPWQLTTNLSYQIAMARFKYRMCPGSIPPATNIPAQAEYWDKYYNCNPEKGTPSEYIKNYNLFVTER